MGTNIYIIAMAREAGVFHLPPRAKKRVAISQLKQKVNPINNAPFLMFLVTATLSSYH